MAVDVSAAEGAHYKLISISLFSPIYKNSLLNKGISVYSEGGDLNRGPPKQTYATYIDVSAAEGARRSRRGRPGGLPLPRPQRRGARCNERGQDGLPARAAADHRSLAGKKQPQKLFTRWSDSHCNNKHFIIPFETHILITCCKYIKQNIWI